MLKNSSRLSSFWYAPVLVSAMGLMFARILVMARLLSITEFARFSAALLVASTFCMLGCLGLYFALQRDWPKAAVRGRSRAGVILLMQCGMVGCACALAGVMVAGLGGSLAGLPAPLLALSIVCGLAQQLFLAVTLESRSRGQTLRYAWQNLARALALFFTGVLAAILTDSTYWVLATEAMGTLLLTMTIFRQILVTVSLRFDTAAVIAWRRMRQISWRSALVLLVTGVFGFVLVNADRWLAAELFDAKVFAQYAFAGTVLLVTQSLQALVNAWAFPRLARQHADQGPRDAYRLCMRITCIALGLGTLAIAPLWWLLNAAIQHGYPSYTGAQALLPIFLVLGVFRVADFWTTYLVVAGREMLLLKLQLVIGVIGLALWTGFTQPLTPSKTSLTQVGTLALFLGIALYVAAAVASWKIARSGQPSRI